MDGCIAICTDCLTWELFSSTTAAAAAAVLLFETITAACHTMIRVHYYSVAAVVVVVPTIICWCHERSHKLACLLSVRLCCRHTFKNNNKDDGLDIAFWIMDLFEFGTWNRFLIKDELAKLARETVRIGDRITPTRTASRRRPRRVRSFLLRKVQILLSIRILLPSPYVPGTRYYVPGIYICIIPHRIYTRTVDH